ncbi:hypothetical protein LTS10_011000 [Elasticomyces elasticus]|nr:hypothetical protein LTS10_011000 [Elasticomyces elasticus]
MHNSNKRDFCDRSKQSHSQVKAPPLPPIEALAVSTTTQYSTELNPHDEEKGSPDESAIEAQEATSGRTGVSSHTIGPRRGW